MKHECMKPVFWVFLLVTTVMSCDNWDDWVDWDESTIEHAKYTGPNTAQIVYKSMRCDTLLTHGGVRIYNKDYTKTYKIREESSHKVYGRSKYFVDITVEPNWEPGDHVTVSGGGYFQYSAEFDVPK
ncbi:MAG: hypothetical protein LBG73_09910 [Spirochaetaceae bacterium]|nr:hypothetical protein [Spirochaetaceae bacterium]